MGRNKASCIHLLPVPQTYQRRNWHAFDIRAIAWRYTRVTTFISPLLLHRQQHVVTASGSNAYAINLSVRAGSPYVSGTFRFKTVYNVEPPPIFIIDVFPKLCPREKEKKRSYSTNRTRNRNRNICLTYTHLSPIILLNLQVRFSLVVRFNLVHSYN